MWSAPDRLSTPPRAGGVFTILVSSAGRRVSLLRSLREATIDLGLRPRIIACDTDWTAPAMHVADAAVIVPFCTDADFPGVVTELAARESVDLVVPTIDPELAVWSSLRHRLAAAGTTVAVSGPQTVAIAADKRRTHEHFQRNGIACPRQAAPVEALGDRDSWRLPVIVKPAFGSASAGVQRVDTWAQLETFVDVTAHDETPFVVEECAPGVEHTVDVYVDRTRRAHCPVVRRRLAVRAGEVSKAQVIRDAAIECLVRKIAESLPDAFGALNVQVFVDKTAVLAVEINARFAGGYPLTWRAGGRYGDWLIRGVAFDAAPPASVAIDDRLLMLRWDEEVFVAGVRS